MTHLCSLGLVSPPRVWLAGCVEGDKAKHTVEARHVLKAQKGMEMKSSFLYDGCGALVSLAGKACSCKKPRLTVFASGLRVVECYTSGQVAACLREGFADVAVWLDAPGRDRLVEVTRLLEKGVPEGRSDVFKAVRDIRVDPLVTGSLAMSSRAFAMHADGTFVEDLPRYIGMQYVVADQDGGGASTFLPVKAILKRLSIQAIAALRLGIVAYDREATKDSKGANTYQGNILMDDGLRWRDDEAVSPRVVDGRGTNVATGIEEVRRAIVVADQEGDVYERLMPEGSIVFWNNRTALHGRRALSGSTSYRHTRRIWI